MSSDTEALTIYRELADRYDKFGQFSMRDRFLMLAADVAYHSGQPQEAERLRQRLLSQNRHHMLRPYNTFPEALAAPDVQTYLNDLRANYPPEAALQLLEGMKGNKPSAVDQTQAVDWTPKATPTSAASIPKTAPLVDPYSSPNSGVGKPAKPTSTPYRLVEDTASPTIPTPAQPRPLAQPLPGRKVPNTAAREPDGPPLRPTAALPAASVPKATPAAEKPAAPVRKPAPFKPAQAKGKESAFLPLLLTGIAIVAALATAGYTLAKPFLGQWLP